MEPHFVGVLETPLTPEPTSYRLKALRRVQDDLYDALELLGNIKANGLILMALTQVYEKLDKAQTKLEACIPLQ